MFGFIALNKRTGLTSRKTLDNVERLVFPHKVGHAGTLDPLAEGILVACLGPATKLVRYVQDMPKTYTASFRFGLDSDTEDIEGKVEVLNDARIVTPDELADVLPKFVGRIKQQPPKFSALRVKGKRAYDLARKGKQVDLKPREIDVFKIDLVQASYPDFQLLIQCGSGTYVRSLGRDIAKELGTAAVMTGLIRTSIGGFQFDRSLSWESLGTIRRPEELKPFLISPLEGLQLGHRWPTAILNPHQIRDLQWGKPIFSKDFAFDDFPTKQTTGNFAWLAVDNHGNLMAVMESQEPSDSHRSVLNFTGYWKRQDLKLS